MKRFTVSGLTGGLHRVFFIQMEDLDKDLLTKISPRYLSPREIAHFLVKYWTVFVYVLLRGRS